MFFVCVWELLFVCVFVCCVYRLWGGGVGLRGCGYLLEIFLELGMGWGGEFCVLFVLGIGYLVFVVVWEWRFGGVMVMVSWEGEWS